MIKWVVELSEFQVIFAPKMNIKWQALADYIVESTCSSEATPKDIKESTK